MASFLRVPLALLSIFCSVTPATSAQRTAGQRGPGDPWASPPSTGPPAARRRPWGAHGSTRLDVEHEQVSQVSLLQARVEVRKKNVTRDSLFTDASQGQPRIKSTDLERGNFSSWLSGSTFPVHSARGFADKAMTALSEQSAKDVPRHFVPTINRHTVFPGPLFPHGSKAGKNASTSTNSSNSSSIASDVEEYQETSLLPAVLVLLLSILVGNCLSVFRYTKRVPESATILGVSILLGFIVRRAVHLKWIDSQDLSILDARLLNGFFLPILMFYGGWSLEIDNFASQFEYVATFAIGGTLLTFFLVTTLSWKLGSFGLHGITDWHDNAVFGALIAATDPVATLSSYLSLGIPKKEPLLNTLVVGESLMNDFVAIVLFGVLNHPDVAREEPWFLEMMGLFFGSTALGFVATFALVLLLRAARLPGRDKALTLYIGIAGYLVFILADTLGLSGIIAGLFAGIVFRRYGGQHFSTSEEESKAAHVFESLSHLMETGVFVMCGISTALLKNLNGFYFGLTAVILCLFSRVIVVIVCSAGCNVLKHLNDDRPSIITANHQAMMVLGCLRGGIALVLALEIGDWMPHETKSTIIEGVFIVIVALLLLCGGTTDLALEALGFATACDEEGDGRQDAIVDKPSLQTHASVSLLDDKNPDRFVRIAGRRLDAWFRDFLVGSPEDARSSSQREASI